MVTSASKSLTRRTLIVATVALTVLVAGCTSAPATTPSPDISQPASKTAVGAASVTLKEMKYSPAVLTVATGTLVTWTNAEAMGHTVTPTDKAQWGTEGSDPAPAKWLQNGQSWSFTFTKPGTYKYYCIPHASKGADGEYRGMAGTVIVEGEGPASTPSAKVEVPGTYILVDHALTRAIDRGAAGLLIVTGDDDPEIFQGASTAGSGH